MILKYTTVLCSEKINENTSMQNVSTGLHGYRPTQCVISSLDYWLQFFRHSKQAYCSRFHLRVVKLSYYIKYMYDRVSLQMSISKVPRTGVFWGYCHCTKGIVIKSREVKVHNVRLNQVVNPQPRLDYGHNQLRILLFSCSPHCFRYLHGVLHNYRHVYTPSTKFIPTVFGTF